MVNRRDFIKFAGAAGLVVHGGRAFAITTGLGDAAPRPGAGPLPANLHGRVLVVGGGMAGAAAAKHLRLWGGSGVRVTLVERDPLYAGDMLGNLVLTGQRAPAPHRYPYGHLAARYGVEVVTASALAVDPRARTVILAGGRRLAYDRLILAPGVDFDLPPGLDSTAAQARVPHAWRGDGQRLALRERIAAMPAGGCFVMTIPTQAHGAALGAYERACLVSDWLARHRPGARVVVLDANPPGSAEAQLLAAAQGPHRQTLEHHAGVALTAIDPGTLTVDTGIGRLRADVLNVIPAQRAAHIVAASGLANVGQRWAGVDMTSYEALAAPHVHVIGDAAATTLPKGGQVANQQAKVCARAVLQLLAGATPDPLPVLGATCYVATGMDSAMRLNTAFAYDAASASMRDVSGRRPRGVPCAHREMVRWHDGLVADSFA